MSVARTIELENGHDVSVNLRLLGAGWVVDSIDLEIDPYQEIECPEGGPYLTEGDALAAAKAIAERALRR